MERNLLKTRTQIAQELGISYNTLRRRIKASGLEIKGNLIAPCTVREIKALFNIYVDFVNTSSSADTTKEDAG